MTRVLPYHGRQPLEIASPRAVRDPLRLGLGRLLDRRSWASCCSCRGATALRSRGEPAATSARRSAEDARTAIVMPICNEDVARRVRRTARDLRVAARHRRARPLRFLRAVATAAIRTCASPRSHAWAKLCRAVGGFGRIFYRWRQHRIKRKSGNIADFCRRWGAQLPLHGRARRRQRHERRLPDDAGAHDGGQPRRRHHPDRAARRGPRHLLRARPAVRHPGLRTAVHRRPALLAARRVALLGPQRDHPRRTFHAALRARPPAGPRARFPARSCRTTSSRPR